MVHRRLDWGAPIGLALLAALLLVNGWLSYRNTRRLEDDSAWVAHTYEVLDALEETRSLARQAFAEQRSYLVTGDEARLRSFRNASGAARAAVARVQELTEDNPRQQARVPNLLARLAAAEGALSSTAAVRREGRIEATRVLAARGDGERAMRSLDALVGEMRGEEQELLALRRRVTEQVYLVAVTTIVLAAVLGLLAVAAVAGLLRRYRNSQEEAAAVLHRERALLEATLVSIGDGVITTDAEGRVTFLNGVAAQLTGWAPGEAAGRPLGEVFQILSMVSRRPVDNPAERALREGRVIGRANRTLLISRDGTEWPLDDSAAPIRGGGAIGGAVLVFREVGERYRAERKLAEAQRQTAEALATLDALLMNAPIGIGFYDEQGRLIRLNKALAQIKGLPVEAHVGRRFTDVLPGTPAVVRDAFARVLRTGEAVLDEEVTDETTAEPGQARHWVVNSYPVRLPDGRVIGVGATVMDVTARKALEEELREADRRKDEFLATLAHELRNPLAPIRNAVGVLRLIGPPDPRLGQVHELIERQVAHLVRLVDDLLEVSRITRGKVELRRAPVPLAAVVQNAVETSSPLIEAARHGLTITVPSEPVVVDGDAVRLTQVVANLLNNAAKYTPEGGHVWVAVERQASAAGGQAVVRVRDNGVGIPADMLPRVFDMFTQVNRTLRRAQGGLGIGLTLVKRLVEMHGGTVAIRSEGRGHGTEVTVRLPLAVAEAGQGGKEVSEGQATGCAPRRILVVDDDVDAADSLATLLSLSGHEVRRAYDGPAAVAQAGAFAPDFILLDLGMPGMDGYETARAVRDLQVSKKAVLVALTGWGQEEDRRRTQEAGFDAHLVKPVDSDALQNLLATVPAG